MRPDGATLIPWAQGKPLARDVTAPDTYAPSHLSNTSLRAGAATDKAVVSKTAKYDKLRGTHMFFPVASETGGPWNERTSDGASARNRKKVDHRHVGPVGNAKSFPAYIHNHPERGNAVAFQNTLPTE